MYAYLTIYDTTIIAAICYLPTRVKNVIEVYHTVSCTVVTSG